MIKNMTLKELHKAFSKIPSKKWITKNFRDSNGCCAYGHILHTLSINESLRGELHRELLGKGINIVNVNDGVDQRFQSRSIRKRVLDAIKSVL